MSALSSTRATSRPSQPAPTRAEAGGLDQRTGKVIEIWCVTTRAS